jgi:hypothetical protein
MIFAAARAVDFFTKVDNTVYTNAGMYYVCNYRVAAIFPEHFQSFTIALKNHLFYSFFRSKPSQLFAEQYAKINRHIPAKMN